MKFGNYLFEKFSKKKLELKRFVYSFRIHIVLPTQTTIFFTKAFIQQFLIQNLEQIIVTFPRYKSMTRTRIWPQFLFTSKMRIRLWFSQDSNSYLTSNNSCNRRAWLFIIASCFPDNFISFSFRIFLRSGNFVSSMPEFTNFFYCFKNLTLIFGLPA